MARVNSNKENIIDKGIFLGEYKGENLQNTESDLVVVDKVLYKLIFGKYIHKKQAVLEFFHDLDYDLPITIIDLLYENNKLFGYTMKFLDDYVTLYELLKSDISLEERKKIALELVKIYEKLLNLKVVYFDWHSKNLMFKNSLKLLDADSAIMTNNVQYDINSRRNLLRLCLSVLNGIDIDFDLELDEREKDELLDKVVEDEEMFLSRMMPLSFEFLKKEINSYTLNKVDYTRELIMKG